MNPTYHINEFFNSVQGEGRETGKPVFFLRFAGCNLACPFCDTHHAKTNYTFDVHQLVDFVKMNSLSKSIVLTGGEPMLVKELEEFVLRIKADGFWVSMETNGTILPSEWMLRHLDAVSVAPKRETELTLETFSSYFQTSRTVPLSMSIKLLTPLFSTAQILGFLNDIAPALRGFKNLQNRMTVFVMPVNEELTVDVDNSEHAYAMAERLAQCAPFIDVRFGTQYHKLIGVK